MRTSFRELTGCRDRAYLFLDLTARLPAAMLPLGTLLFVAHATGSYADGGLAVATLSIGGGLGGALIGVASDRIGQRPVSLAATALQAIALAVFVTCGHAPRPVLLAIPFLVGLANPQVGAMSRSRWVALARTRLDRNSFTATAMAFEGALDETSFVAGPALIGTLAGIWSPMISLLVTLVVLVLTQTAFGLHPSTLPGGVGAASGRSGGFPFGRIAPLLLGMLAVGTIFGASQTGVTARMSEQGLSGWTGVVYGVMGVGSASAGLFTTRLPARWPMWGRIAGAGIALVITGAVLVSAVSPVALALAGLLVGFSVAPALISSYSAAEPITPPGWGTSVMTALSTGTVVGVAIGASISGGLVDAHGPGAALAVVPIAGVVVAIAGLLARDGRRRLTR